MARVLICLDKFRGSATAAQACAWLADGVRAARKDLDVVERPVADGGEGTIDALVVAGFARHFALVQDPLGRSVTAAFAVRGDHAVVEMAQASGVALTLDRRDPMAASTYGTGELIRSALDLGCRTLTLTVGGSATTDGGAGALRALGVRLLDADGRELSPGGAALVRLVRIELSGLDPRLAGIEVTLASDVDSPLLGPTGAAAVYGPQKGASVEDVPVLELGLTRLADVLAAASGTDCRDSPGAGAAGGLGFAALSVLAARRVSGIDFVLDALDLRAAVAASSQVVVGEGSLDRQSLDGKAPLGVAALAQAEGVPVVAVAGRITVPGTELQQLGIGAAFSLLDRAGDEATAMRDTRRLLTEIGTELAAGFAR